MKTLTRGSPKGSSSRRACLSWRSSRLAFGRWPRTCPRFRRSSTLLATAVYGVPSRPPSSAPTIPSRRSAWLSDGSCSSIRSCRAPTTSPAPPATTRIWASRTAAGSRWGRAGEASGPERASGDRDQARRPDHLERRFQPPAVLGRPRRRPRGPGPLPDHLGERDGPEAGRAGPRARGDPRVRAALRRGLRRAETAAA